jgi:hypothetical protein
MVRKTVSLDIDVYRTITKKQRPQETLSAALRRLLADEKDPADYLDELFAKPPTVDTALLRRRQKMPVRSSGRHHAH